MGSQHLSVHRLHCHSLTSELVLRSFLLTRFTVNSKHGLVLSNCAAVYLLWFSYAFLFTYQSFEISHSFTFSELEEFAHGLSGPQCVLHPQLERLGFH